MTTWTKYLLLQTPGWLVMAVLLLGLWHWLGLSPWVAIGLFVVWVVKDFLLYPFVRSSYETTAKTGSQQLVGALGVARERLAPNGYVHVHGELWQATAEPSHTPIAAGSTIRVQAAHGLTLIVTAEEAHERLAAANRDPMP
ncbi:MAG TPA: NfeD family protein [Candidatus Binatia bacterium]|jgi:membrane protein implicated in regulation of membrane protease activity|nr:NfeD family protein [Candidatus Binatia bacterium]